MYRNSVCLDLGTHQNDLKVTKLFPLYSEIKNKTRTITIFQWFSYLCSSGISRISDATEYPSPREKPEPLISIDTRADSVESYATLRLTKPHFRASRGLNSSTYDPRA